MTIIKCSAVGGSASSDSRLPVHLMSTIECVSQQSGSYDVDIYFFSVGIIYCVVFQELM